LAFALAYALAYKTVVTRTVRSRILLLRGTNVPGNIHSQERKFLGMKVPGSKSFRNFRSWERKFPVGTFAPRSENTKERKVPEPVVTIFS